MRRLVRLSRGPAPENSSMTLPLDASMMPPAGADRREAEARHEPAGAPPPMPLSSCRPGRGGVVLEIRAAGPIGQRLMEMGLIEGTRVDVLRVAPFGDPIEVRLLDFRLSLRKAEAREILIRP